MTADDVTTLRMREAEVNMARAKANRLIAWAAIASGVCVVMALSVSLYTLRDRDSFKNENGRKLDELEAQLAARDSVTAQRLQCQQRFASATSYAFSTYEVALGDLIVEIVTPLATQVPDRTGIQAAIDVLSATLVEFRARVEEQQQWDSRGQPLPCSLTSAEVVGP